MNDNVKRALSYYDIGANTVVSLNDDDDAFKLTDDEGKHYFLKIYGMNNDYDIIPGERVYHTYEQIQLESEILLLLSDSALKTAVPMKNKDGGFVTTLAPDADGLPMYATVTSFIDGLAMKSTEAPTEEMAHAAGVSAALLHMESKKRLLPIAVKRPYKRQEYVRKMQEQIARGLEIGSLTTAQYEIICGCCHVIVECMDKLDNAPENNIGLVHTDIINGNIVYAQNHGTLIDFSRSVYSYYLYDLAEMCLHNNFGGSSPDLQKAILRGYHSVKPLGEDDLFAMQALFALFILTIVAVCIESKENAWMEGVLKWFADEVHPGLVSGAGYMKVSIRDFI